jgi:hypothetical protein
VRPPLVCTTCRVFMKDMMAWRRQSGRALSGSSPAAAPRLLLCRRACQSRPSWYDVRRRELTIEIWCSCCCDYSRYKYYGGKKKRLTATTVRSHRYSRRAESNGRTGAHSVSMNKESTSNVNQSGLISRLEASSAIAHRGKAWAFYFFSNPPFFAPSSVLVVYLPRALSANPIRVFSQSHKICQEECFTSVTRADDDRCKLTLTSLDR